MECCIRCLAQGVGATHIIDGRQVSEDPPDFQLLYKPCKRKEVPSSHAASSTCKPRSIQDAVLGFLGLQLVMLLRLQNHSLLMELLTDEGVGSMIVGSSAKTPTAHKEEKIREAIPA